MSRVQSDFPRGVRLAMRVGNFIPGWARRVIAIMIEFLAPSNSTVRTRWLRSPQIDEGAEVCVFVSYAPGGVMPEHSRFHAEAWAHAGFRVVVVLNTDVVDSVVRAWDLSFAAGILVRENRGYDFGAWASALNELPVIRTSSLVALVNDSVYGPLNSFDDMLQRVRALDGDVIGVTESREFVRHFQSYLLFFRPKALNAAVFWHFWKNIRAGGRIIAIYRYEQGLLATMERAGLRCAALFRAHDARNPTLTRWRALIDEGFPYVKVGLLRDNVFDADLSGWQEVLFEHGYDPALAHEYST
jgi:lipopolysaccharide biosynthesis protein